ncbi:MAG: hypothetical protein ACXWXC_08740, partial [Aeromicrobium sp.]
KTEFEERPNVDLASTKLAGIGVAAVYRAIGTLFVDVPGGGPVAALFRFAPPHAAPPGEDD